MKSNLEDDQPSALLKVILNATMNNQTEVFHQKLKKQEKMYPLKW